jgi:chromosomal replication initiation ATPase DnaA
MDIQAQDTHSFGHGMISVSRPLTKAQATLRADRARARFVIDLVAMATGVSAGGIACATRSHAGAARARQMAMYLSYVAYSWPLARIGRAFDRDRTTAGYACRLIEDLRDDRAFDARLNELEACLSDAPAPSVVNLTTGFSPLAYAGRV